MNRTTHKLLAAVLVLQGLTLLSQWTAHSLPAAQAGEVSDPASRQIQMVEGIKGTNDRLDKLIGMLEGGNLQVKVVTPDDNKKPDRSGK